MQSSKGRGADIEDHSPSGCILQTAQFNSKSKEDDELIQLTKSALTCQTGECPLPSEEMKNTHDKVLMKSDAGEFKNRISTLDLLIEQEKERYEKRRAANRTHAEKLRQQIEDNSKRKLLDRSEKNSCIWQSPLPCPLKRWSRSGQKKAPSFHSSTLMTSERERNAIRRNARAAYDHQLLEQIRENANRRLFENQLHKADALSNPFDEGSNKFANSKTSIETQIEEEKRKQQREYMELLKDQIKENAYRREMQRRVYMEEELRMNLEFQKILDKEHGKEERNVSCNGIDKERPVDCKRLKQLEYQKILDDQIMEKLKGKQRKNNACGVGRTSSSGLHRNGNRKVRPQCSLDDITEFHRPAAGCVAATPGMLRGDLPNPIEILKQEPPPISPLSDATLHIVSGMRSNINNDSRTRSNNEVASSATINKCTMRKLPAAHFDELLALDSESVLLPITCSNAAADDEIRL